VKIAIGSDHAAFAHRKFIAAELRKDGHSVTEFGAPSTESYDYPDAAKAVADAVASGRAEQGVLMCGTGIGMCMSANKVRGIRAALCHDEFTTKMAREHNNANVLCLGGRVLTPEKAAELTRLYLATPFAGGRHQRRIDKIAGLEKDQCG
jgi:ribose 5-phosphate isomerase B